MVMKLRSSNTIPSGYQSPEDQRPGHLRLSDVTSTLDNLQKMCSELTANTDFEKGIQNLFSLLISQVKEIKVDQINRHEEGLYRHCQLTRTVDDMSMSVVKSEQYTRRDVLTVVGLSKPDGPESETELTNKVATILSQSGEEVKPTDLSACHRNARNNRTIRGKIVPPSVTVKFDKISKKDKVLRQYKNFDSENRKTRDVRVYQSLSEHYASVRKDILDFFNSDKNSDKDYGPIFNPGLKVKWVTYQSPTAGFAIKLQTGEYFKGVHMWHQFVENLVKVVPSCRVN
ncbi:hypothetical protein ACHWQZ_G013861 [Mnemiopsis leidyi]